MQVDLARAIASCLVVARQSHTTGARRRPRAYEFNLPNGKYTVRLHFAETFTGITGVGQRVYSFAVQGQKPEKNFDIFKEAGGMYKAIQREYKGVAVTDGKLRITFTPNVENAAINGIEIFAE